MSLTPRVPGLLRANYWRSTALWWRGIVLKITSLASALNFIRSIMDNCSQALPQRHKDTEIYDPPHPSHGKLNHPPEVLQHPDRLEEALPRTMFQHIPRDIQVVGPHPVFRRR